MYCWVARPPLLFSAKMSLRSMALRSRTNNVLNFLVLMWFKVAVIATFSVPVTAFTAEQWHTSAYNSTDFSEFLKGLNVP